MSFILSVPPETGLDQSISASTAVPEAPAQFLYLPLNVSGPSLSSRFSLLWSPVAVHKGRSEERGRGVCRLGEGGGCDPPSIQEGPEMIKSGGSTGASSASWQSCSLPKARPQSPRILPGMSVVWEQKGSCV